MPKGPKKIPRKKPERSPTAAEMQEAFRKQMEEWKNSVKKLQKRQRKPAKKKKAD
jgi:hypothetical protein